MKTKSLLFAALLAIAIAPSAFAQLDGGLRADFGAVHPAKSQVLLLNISLNDSCSVRDVPFEVEIYDKTGKTLFAKTGTISSGMTQTVGLGPDSNDVRVDTGSDIYFVVAPGVNLILPCIKVAFPPGPCKGSDMLTLTMETLDTSTGRQIGFVNTAHVVLSPTLQ